jgi:hypothetical protein
MEGKLHPYTGTKEDCFACDETATCYANDEKGMLKDFYCDAHKPDESSVKIGTDIEHPETIRRAIAYYAYALELESDDFAFSCFSPSEFEAAEKNNGQLPTKIVILFNGETGEWEAWEDGDNEPMYQGAEILDVIDDCLCDYEIIEVHNND